MVQIAAKRKRAFLRYEERYEKQSGGDTIRIGEVDIPLPKQPPDKHIKNAGLRPQDQYYQKEVVPGDIAGWSPKDIEEFALSQWWRRIHGEWQYIKGKPYYIPGGAVVFFDFATLESGLKAQFRYPTLELMTFFYEFVEPNDNIFGLYDLKTRRIGDTANFLHILWERTTRHRGVRGGLQSYTDKMAEKTFARLVKANRNMPFFFRPQHTGSDKEFLAFLSPSDLNSLKKIRARDKVDVANIDADFLGSYLDYEATVTGKYDGEQMFTAYMDEVLKIPPFRMDAEKQYYNLRRCVSLFGESKIYGKILVSSTAEKIEGTDDQASTIEVGRWFWDNSDPAQMKDNPDGRTNCGMVRLLRGYREGAPLDEYGFPKAEQAEKFRAAKIAKALKLGDNESLHDIFRKEPGSADEALMEDNQNCPLYPEICQMRMRQIEEGLDRHNNAIRNYRLPYVEGVLAWKGDRPNTEVVFVPVKGGPWHISQHPERPNSVQMQRVMVRNEMGQLEEKVTWLPLNAAFYRGGSDPISSNPRLITKGSKGSIVVKRRLYLPHEAEKMNLSDDGLILNPESMKTNQPVADYLFRPNTPNEFFRQIIMACWYYGMPIMIEMDKAEAYAYMVENHYYGFLMYEPASVSQARGRRPAQFHGVRSQGDVVGMYVTKLQMYIANYWPAVKHPRLLKTASRFIVKNRTKYDHAVGWGMTEIADTDNRYTANDEESVNEWKTNPFSDA